jgi:hypothetical protein
LHRGDLALTSLSQAEAFVGNTPEAHLALSSGRKVDSPFGSGCVGTSGICATSLSSAHKTERATLRREVPPELWLVREDVEWERELREAEPEVRLARWLARLGGKDAEQKLSLSQAELLRLQREEEEHFRKEKDTLEAHSLARLEAARAERRAELGWRAHFVADIDEAPHYGADRDNGSLSKKAALRKQRSLDAAEAREHAEWHAALRARFEHPLGDTDEAKWKREFDEARLSVNGVSLGSMLKKRHAAAATH